MKYLNLPVALGRDESILRATSEQIGIWFLLQIYCHDQMNGGMIVGCMQWPDAMWHRVAGTNGLVIASESPLWHSTAMALVVHHYDQRAEDTYRRKQQMGRVYIERRWAATRKRKIIEIESGISGKPQKNNQS